MARILVIDDDVDSLNIISRLLSNAGFDVGSAQNGNDGIRLFEEYHADLIITDILMPEKEGLETIIELRRNYPELKIIAISGGGSLGSQSYLSLASKLGADSTFIKPFDLHLLLAKVRELLAEHPPAAE